LNIGSPTSKGQQDHQQHGESTDAGDKDQQKEAEETGSHPLLRAAIAHVIVIDSQDLKLRWENGTRF
jgi:hypothetical protein